MTALLITLAVLFLLFFFVRKLYDWFWNKGLTCKVSFKDAYAVEGESSILQEVVINDKFLPMPVVEVDFHMDRRIHFADEENNSVSDQTYRRDVFALSFRQQITRSLQLQCVGRGYFRVTETGVTGRDLFLQTEYITSQPQNTDFYILPRPVPTEKVNIPFSQIMGTVLSRKRIYDDPFEFAGIREYSRSDPMKYINWKAAARAGELLTNLHESTLSQRVILLVDMEGKGIQQADFYNEASVRIASSLCERLLRAGIELGLYSNGADVQTGSLWKIDSVSGTNNILYTKKKFACLESGNDLTPIEEVPPPATAAGGDEELLVLVTRSQREDVALRFSELLGKRQGLVVIPYRNTHKEVLSTAQADVVWLEV